MTALVSDIVNAQHHSLDDLFSESARKYPDRCALFVAGQHYSYSRLDTECSSIEHAMHRAGIGGGQRAIGLVYSRSLFSYAAIVAIMRSNNVYVPLNPKAPAERFLQIIDDAGIDSLIVDPTDAVSDGVLDALRPPRQLRIILPDINSTLVPQTSLEGVSAHLVSKVSQGGVTDPNRITRNNRTAADNRLAYIIYTSGSTGEPKGVSISHQSACRCMERLHRVFETDEQDRFTQFSALSFDYSLAELFWCWKSGAALYVPAASDALVPLNFAIRHRITVWFSVPALASFIVKLGLLKSNVLPSVRLCLFGGEALPYELVNAWAEAAPHSRVFNLYGPTEVTIVSTFYECARHNLPRSGMVPIGNPLPGLQCIIVDDGRAVEGDDAPGELWLAGDQLAAGYWNNPAATQAAFVHHHFGDALPNIWYRTGDLVSYQHGAGISFRGRIDRQVKLRGLRIELQEIESVLRETIGCALVAVVPVRNTGGMCERIVAYCDHLNANEATVKAACLNRMPSYMVPERIFELDSFPFSSHGKIDYIALAQRTMGRSP